ncbi:glutathione peroxidase [Parashewanella spongiae]|uniref:Glutathione peroxidase n=1 Tax=Parashewanella spongiae TaxID=342950 RepID=A0A3A6TH11_9GAMM|nr:glutathione peroxidase [Parashewanella spongiae]MCL1079149.1 glutathione peroxidase [Parashewanella spongiae]RJY10754.1 glutathione peroxidase [Parashewanella spongiae]
MSTSFYELSATDINGDELPLRNYQDKVLLIVNTASGCGFTPQYQGLESLYQKYQTDGFTVLGFPCNQFGKQEKGSEKEIASFCELNFGVTFPLFSKVEVNGDNTHPIFKYLKQSAKGLLGSESIKWNFTKFLVNKKGEVIKRYAPTTKPEAIKLDIESLL